MSASISSISPQRRSGPMASPYAFSNQQTFSYQQPLPSPQSYGNNGFMQPPFPSNPYQSGHAQSRQLRGSRASYSSNRNSGGGVLPTPDPTIGSVISDEDVALQLMRLGDPTAFSHGRTSTSTALCSLSAQCQSLSSIHLALLTGPCHGSQTPDPRRAAVTSGMRLGFRLRSKSDQYPGMLCLYTVRLP